MVLSGFFVAEKPIVEPEISWLPLMTVMLGFYLVKSTVAPEIHLFPNLSDNVEFFWANSRNKLLAVDDSNVGFFEGKILF